MINVNRQPTAHIWHHVSVLMLHATVEKTRYLFHLKKLIFVLFYFQHRPALAMYFPELELEEYL